MLLESCARSKHHVESSESTTHALFALRPHSTGLNSHSGSCPASGGASCVALVHPCCTLPRASTADSAATVPRCVATSFGAVRE
jgi:hypothetical protein